MSIVVALALNSILLAGFAASAQKWQVSNHPQRAVTWVTAVAIDAVQAVAHSALAETPSRPPAARPSPQVTPAAAPPSKLESAAASPVRALARDESNDVRFYTYGEVDQAAEPDSDWNLDAALLDGAGLKLLVFDAFISSTGEVVACTILQPAQLPVDIRSLLEDRLHRTTLRPAKRAGEAVPSVRRIELSVQ